MPRITWDDLPAGVRAAVEDALGSPVTGHRSHPGGFSPGTADTVTCGNGRQAFVKAVHPNLNAESPELHRRELRVVRALPPGLPVPALIAGFDDVEGWVVLVLENVDGRHPELPWTPEAFAPVLEATMDLSARLTPSPLADLPRAEDLLRDNWLGYARCLEAPPADLDPWTLAHLAELDRRALQSLTTVGGSTVCHHDLRSDNILLRDGDGQAVFIDWPWAMLAAPWLDSAFLVLEFAVRPGGDSRHAETDAALVRIADRFGVGTEPLVNALLGACGFWTWQSRQPDPPGIPTLRAFQRLQADGITEWLRHTSLAAW